MLVDLTPIIRGGAIDNTIRGTTKLLLHYAGEEEPLQLTIPGDCLGDIAGCIASFQCLHELPEPVLVQTQLYQFIKDLQNTTTPLIMGDMTLSRRQLSSIKEGRLANALSLEFFAGIQTRVLIESESFSSQISLPEWMCDRAVENAREFINMSTLHDHVLANVASFRGPALNMLGNDMPVCKWDHILNRVEAYMAIVPSVNNKYMVHPRGLLAEAFVLDRLDVINRLAQEAEKGRDIGFPLNWRGWEVCDFMTPSEGKRLRRAMSTPLFKAIAGLISVIRDNITSKFELYRKNNAVEHILSIFASVISHSLATIMLTHEHSTGNKALVLRRAETLALRIKDITAHAHECLPIRVSGQFSKAAGCVLHELQNIVH